MAFVPTIWSPGAVRPDVVNTRPLRRASVARASLAGPTLPDNVGFAFQTYEKGNSAEGNRIVEKYVASNPADWRIWKQWAELESRYGCVENAINILEHAVERYPKRTGLWSFLAGLEERCGNRREALAVYKRAVAKAGECVCLLLPWAVLESEQGRLAKSREIFKLAASKAAHDRNIYTLWGTMELEAANDIDAARKVYERGAKSCPNAACIWLAWAQLEGRLGNRNEAERFFCEAAMADPRDPCIWLYWGVMEVRSNF